MLTEVELKLKRYDHTCHDADNKRDRNDEKQCKRYAVTLQPATLLLIKSAATTALGLPTSDLLQSVITYITLHRNYLKSPMVKNC